MKYSYFNFVAIFLFGCFHLEHYMIPTCFFSIFCQNSIPICRLWAEVFHVTTSNSGTVKWTQVSEDLVPVNITCVQDSPEVIFHITAYNSQVEKILDVRLLQPGNTNLSVLELTFY